MWRFLWKSLRHSFRLHLLVPLLVFIASGLLIARLSIPEGITLCDGLPHEFLPRLAVVYFTFIVVLGFVLSEEGAARVTNIGALDYATAYLP